MGEKKKILIVNLRREKKPHTQGKRSPDASTKMHSPFPTGLSASWYRADTAFLKSQHRIAGEAPMGALGKGAEMGILEVGEVGKAARGIGGVHLQTIENV